MRERSDATRRGAWLGVALCLALALLTAATPWLDPLAFPLTAANLLLNALPVALLFGLLFVLTRRIAASVVLALALLAVFQAINARKLRHLDLPLLPSDAIMLPQVLHSPEIYLHYVQTSIWWWLILPPLAWGLWREPPFALARRWRLGVGLAIVLSLLSSSFGRAPWTPLYETLAPPFEPWAALRNAREHGSVAYFTRQVWSDEFVLPEADAGRLGEFRARLAAEDVDADLPPASTRPDIIVLQSEAFFDPARMRGMESTQWVPQLQALQSRHPHGELHVPAYGGLTTRTEFEVLTGMSLQAFPGTQYPYQQLVMHPLHSLPQWLRDSGYQTAAIHPNGARFYRRHKVLPLLGFERFHAGDEFIEAERYGFYPADAALSRRIRELAEAEGPQFLFGISIENHGPWTPDRPLSRETLKAIPVPAGLDSESADELRRYLHHLQRADAELGRLAEWVLQRETPTVLLFYGDHLPGLNRVFESLGFVDGLHPVQQTVPWLMICRPEVCPRAPRDTELSSHELGAVLLASLGWSGDEHFRALQWLARLPSVDAERQTIAIELARERITQPAAAFTLSAPTPAQLAEVVAWGPTVLEADAEPGTKDLAWWLKAAPSLSRSLRLQLGGHQLQTHFNSDAVMVGIWPRDEMPEGMLASGVMALELVDVETNRIQQVGQLEVSPRAERFALSWRQRAQDLCPVQAWGPDRTSRATPENRQPDGGMGLWIQTACLPKQVEVEIGDRRIPAKTQPGLATVSIPADWLAAGTRMPIALIDVANGERLPVGELQVER